MHYLHFLLLIAILAGQRTVRRLIRPTVRHQPLDADVVGWLRLMTTCDDHDIITSYARATFN